MQGLPDPDYKYHVSRRNLANLSPIPPDLEYPFLLLIAMAHRVPLTAPLAGGVPGVARLFYAARSPHQGIPNAPEHLVILPDKPNVLARRVLIRPSHSPNFVRLHNEGYVSWAGPMFDAHVDKEVSQRPFKGSVMVVNEGSWDGFMDKVRSDPYVKEGIWDMENTAFIPFRTLVRRDAAKANK
ncbi:hypothetical protein SCUP234_07616 [Seiridium cupressi]